MFLRNTGKGAYARRLIKCNVGSFSAKVPARTCEPCVTSHFVQYTDNMIADAVETCQNKMPATLALRVMLGLIHLFQLYALPIDKTILANGIV